MSIVKEEHKATLRKWHEELQEKRGNRASLRRSTTVNDVLSVRRVSFSADADPHVVEN